MIASRMRPVAVGLLLALSSVACDRAVAGGRANGSEVFGEVCARCHGPNGQPNASMIARYGVKSLRTARVQDELKDADIRRQILRGSDNKQMPSFEGAITDEQVAAVIAHVRTFREPAPGATKPESKKAESKKADSKKPDSKKAESKNADSKTTR